MGELTALRPKALVEIEDGDSILDINLRNYLEACDRPDMTVVGGYRWDAIADFTARRQHGRGMLRTVLNPTYEAGPLTSLLVAVEALPADTVQAAFANGDTIFAEEAIRMAADRAAPGFGLLVSREDRPDPDDMRVSFDAAGLVSAVAKCGQHPGPAVISAGFFVVNGQACLDELKQCLGEALAFQRSAGRTMSWHSIMRFLHGRAHAVQPIHAPRSSWHEFDSLECIENYRSAQRFVRRGGDPQGTKDAARHA